MKMKKIYFMRHSEPLKYNNLKNKGGGQVVGQPPFLKL